MPLLLSKGDEFTMNFAAVVTNLKSGLTRFYAKESVFNNELLRTPLWRSSHSINSPKYEVAISGPRPGPDPSRRPTPSRVFTRG
jgi:hypothetical protein